MDCGDHAPRLLARRHAEPRRSRCAPRAATAQIWDGTACKPNPEAAKQLAVGTAALAKLDVDEAKVALDAAEHAGPLDHETNVTLWEQRGIAAAYVDDEATATTAFDMLLALDPAHFLSYKLSPKATFVFEKVLADQQRGAPAIDVNWRAARRSAIRCRSTSRCSPIRSSSSRARPCSCARAASRAGAPPI